MENIILRNNFGNLPLDWWFMTYCGQVFLEFGATKFFVPGRIRGTTIGYGHQLPCCDTWTLENFPQILQVTGFSYGGTFSPFFFAGDGGGGLAHTPWFPCPGGCFLFFPLSRVVSREGLRTECVFSILCGLMGDRRHDFAMLGLMVSTHTHAVRPTDFSERKELHQDPTAYQGLSRGIIVQLLEVLWMIDSLRFSCPCPCLPVVSV